MQSTDGTKDNIPLGSTLAVLRLDARPNIIGNLLIGERLKQLGKIDFDSKLFFDYR